MDHPPKTHVNWKESLLPLMFATSTAQIIPIQPMKTNADLRRANRSNLYRTLLPFEQWYVVKNGVEIGTLTILTMS